MPASNYPQRLCAYVDILGFRGYVASLSDNVTNVTELKNILETVHHPMHLGVSDLRNLEYRTQSISDAVAISIIPTASAMVELFATIEYLAMALLAVGLFHARRNHDGKAKLRQVDVAKRLRRYQSYITNIETGQRRIDVVELIDLAEAIGFDPREAIAALKGKETKKRQKIRGYFLTS